jgi:hypothetical protein
VPKNTPIEKSSSLSSISTPTAPSIPATARKARARIIAIDNVPTEINKLTELKPTTPPPPPPPPLPLHSVANKKSGTDSTEIPAATIVSAAFTKTSAAPIEGAAVSPAPAALVGSTTHPLVPETSASASATAAEGLTNKVHSEADNVPPWTLIESEFVHKPHQRKLKNPKTRSKKILKP